MINLNDHIYSLTPEMTYAGITNLDIRLRAGFIRGGRGSEFGEKPNDYRMELREGYYFYLGMHLTPVHTTCCAATLRRN